MVQKQSSSLKTGGNKTGKKKGMLKVGFSITEEASEKEAEANPNLHRINTMSSITVSKPVF